MPKNEFWNDPNDHRENANLLSEIDPRPITEAPSSITVPPDNEDAIALSFSKKYKDVLRYVAPWHKWMKWDGST